MPRPAPPKTADQRYLTVKEVAGQLRVSPQFVYRLINIGHLPAIKLDDRSGVRIPINYEELLLGQPSMALAEDVHEGNEASVGV